MTRRLHELLQTSPELRTLTRQAGVLQALQQRYERLVPAALHRASRVARLEHGQLTLVADNATIAAKLRQMTLDLIDLFNESGAQVTGIRIRVQVRAVPAARPRLARQLNTKAQRELSELAHQLNDGPLKTALQRLLRQEPPT